MGSSGFGTDHGCTGGRFIGLFAESFSDDYFGEVLPGAILFG